MAEPEQRPAAAPPLAPLEYVQQRRRWPLVVVALVAVLVVAAVVTTLVLRPAGTAGPADPTAAGDLPEVLPAAPGEHPGLALEGAGDAVVYLQTTKAVQRGDLASGATTLTATPAAGGSSTLTAGAGFVVSKTTGAPSGFLLSDGGVAQVLPVVLQEAVRVYPDGAGALWALPAPVQGFRTAVRVDARGARVGAQSIRVPAALGVPTGHLNDALVVDGAEGTYEARTSSVQRVSRGILLAVGSDALLTWDCDTAGRCDARVNQAGQAPTYLPAVRVSITGLYGEDVASATGHGGVLSPDRRWVALQLPKPTRSGATLVLVDLRTGHRVEVPGALARADGTDQAAWTPNGRYLLALTDGRLRAFDTTTEKVVTVGGTPADLLHLTVPGAPTM